MRVLVAGASDGSICGVRDHARVLSAALRELGMTVGTVWVDAKQRTPSLLSHALAARCGDEAPDVVLFHYSVFTFSHRGIPGGVPALAAQLWLLRVPVVLFAHEFAYPWGRRGWRGALQAGTQRAALVPLVSAATTLIATTPERVDWLRSRRWLPQRRVAVVRVFSTITPHPTSAETPPVPGRIGLFSFGTEGLAADAVTRAVAAVARRSPEVHLTLIGAPGPDSPAGDHWRRAANAAGCRIAFTGVAEEAEVSRQLAACQIIVFADPAGPSPRKTSLAAALAHGRAVVALDGPQRWLDLIDCGGAVVVEPQAQTLSNELGRLLADEDARADVGRRGQALYEAELAPERAALRVRDLLLETQMAR